MECEVAVAILYLCKHKAIVCGISIYKKGKELILSVFTIINEETPTRRIYLFTLAV